MDQRSVRGSVDGADRARAGTKEGVGRYVLVIGTVLVIILFVVAYIFTR